MSNKILAFIFLSFFTINGFSQTSQSDFDFPAPENIGTLKKLNLWSTQYYIHKFTSGGKIPIVYKDGTQSGLFADTCNFCTASLEGTGYVLDSNGKVTTINYVKLAKKTFVNCRKCKKFAKSDLAVESWGKALWRKTEGFGDGVLNYRLIPYRTIAIDKTIIPYGTVIYIPKPKGVQIELPNGVKVTHDGYFFAGDTGGAIKENHIDTFTGIYEKNPFPAYLKSTSKVLFEAFIVKNQTIINTLRTAQVRL